MLVEHGFLVVDFNPMLFSVLFWVSFSSSVLNSPRLTQPSVPCLTVLHTACDPGGVHGPLEPEARWHVAAQCLHTGAFPDTLASLLFHMDSTDESGISLHPPNSSPLPSPWCHLVISSDWMAAKADSAPIIAASPAGLQR